MKNEILNNIIERGAYIWGKEASTLGPDTTFDEMNAKSSHISQLAIFLEDKYDIEIPYMGFKRSKTLGEAAEFIQSLLDQ